MTEENALLLEITDIEELEAKIAPADAVIVDDGG
jgi:hypothetical protein